MLKQRAQTTNLKLKQHKELPLHICKLPLSKRTLPPEPMQQCNMRMQQREKSCSLWPGRLDRLHRAIRLPTCYLTAWAAVRSPHETDPSPNFSKSARTNLNTFQMLLGAQIMHKLLPLVDNAWIKAKCEMLQPIASQIYKIHHKVLHMFKWAS
jgi:hypothetical protein